MHRTTRKVLFGGAILFLIVSISNAQSKTNSPPQPYATLKPYLVAMYVANLDDSVKWYQETLGFNLLRPIQEFPKYEVRIAFLQLNGFQLELVERKHSFPVRKKFPELDEAIQGFKKLAFSVDDIESLAALLKKKNVKFLYDVTLEERDNRKWFIVADVDGNSIQFFQPLPKK